MTIKNTPLGVLFGARFVHLLVGTNHSVKLLITLSCKNFHKNTQQCWVKIWSISTETVESIFAKPNRYEVGKRTICEAYPASPGF